MTYAVRFINEECEEHRETFTEYCMAIEYCRRALECGCFAILVFTYDANGKKVDEYQYA